MTVKKDLLNDFQRDANKHTAQHTLQKGSKITNKELNKVLEWPGNLFHIYMITQCKENFGKSLISDNLFLDSEVRLKKKLSPGLKYD